jgi:hypothetical protein
VKAEDGPYEFDLKIIANALAPSVPLQDDLRSYRIGG